MNETLWPTHKVRPGDQTVPPELQIWEYTKHGNLHHFIPATTQQPQASLHQGIFFSIFGNFIQFSIIYPEFLSLFALSNHTAPTYFVHQPAPSASNTSTHSLNMFGPFFCCQISMRTPITPGRSQGFTGGSNYILVAARFFHVKISYCHLTHVSHLSVLPVSFHICSSSPFDIICKSFPYPSSLTRMLINARAHAAVTHQKPLCNSASLCSAFAFVSDPSVGIEGTWQSSHLQKSEGWHEHNAGGFRNVSSSKHKP